MKLFQVVIFCLIVFDTENSAYFEINGIEPAFTNRTDTFCDCLDYIFFDEVRFRCLCSSIRIVVFFFFKTSLHF